MNTTTISFVNPARAGMIRNTEPQPKGPERKPRASGDDPTNLKEAQNTDS